MNEIDYVKKINSILKSDPVAKKYFQNYTIDLQSRLERWQDQTIRIGLIGVTSSGKSTLLNALLGDNILPTAVRPSSGSIIICSKGPVTSAEIVFADDRREKVYEKNVAAALKKYGDEAENTENRYKVKEIHLQSKHFLLPQDVQIIDSPGLDAYGLERHEELTLSTLLPTIDLCLYVVTLKTNSDDTTKRILDQIYDQHKPMIIVQNMLDSLEPKLGKNGRVEKTREMIAEEHVNRTKRILNAIDPKLNEMVQIVQLSAKRAVDGRREDSKQKIKDSQITNLIHMIESYREKIGPQLFYTRGTSLNKVISSILKEEGKLSGSKESFDREIQQMELRLEQQLHSSKNMQERLAQKKQELEKTLTQFNGDIYSFKQQIDNLSSYDLTKAKSILSDIKRKSGQIEDQFLTSMKSMNSNVTAFMDQLGFNLAEMIRSIAVRSSKQTAHNYFELKSKTEKKSRRVKSSGISGKTKRFFGSIFKKDWGFETVYDPVEVLDKSAIQQNIQDFERSFTQALYQKLKEWDHQLQSAVAELQLLQEQQRTALQEKKTHRDELKNLQPIIQKLQQLQKSLKTDLKANERVIRQNATKLKTKKAIVHSGQMVKMEVNEMTYRLYEMSSHILQTIFQTCTEHVESLNRDKKVHKQNVILGWDDLALALFTQRYFNTSITDAEQKELAERGLLIKENHFIVDEMNLSVVKKTELVRMMVQGRFNMYVLVNVAQSGQAESQLRRSGILKLPAVRQAVCNCVVQSFREFLENGAYNEVVDILNELKQLALFKQGEILVNDASPLFSIMHIQLDHSRTVVHDSTQLTHHIKQKMPYLIDSDLMTSAYNQYLNAMMKQTGVK